MIWTTGFSKKCLLISFATAITFASTARETYYGRQFFEAWPAEVSNTTVENNPIGFFSLQLQNAPFASLRNLVHKILSSGHIINGSDYDTIVEDCELSWKPDCIQHKPLSYKTAREVMFGQLHLEQDFNNRYKLKSVYCDRYYNETDFPDDARPGPGQIPSHLVLNAEHTWPQSRFASNDRNYQKSDLNILFPVESNVNSTRSNHPFGEVDSVTSEPCPGALLGKHPSSGNQLIFEPPNSHKGNAARAMFYFAVRYGTTIDPVQERILRKWHKMDPVDAEERQRHEEIFDVQHVRNPFIDFPELADKFSDF